jgi:hypothetical protein
MAAHDIIDVQPGSQLDMRLGELSNALWDINDQLKPIDDAINDHSENTGKWLSTINDTISAGFAAVVAEIAKLNTQPPPLPKPKGVIMATFKVGADNPDIEIALTGSGFMDSDTPPNPTGAGDIDLSVESSNPDAVSASISGQTLSDDGNSVSATVAVHFGAPATDVATLTYRATNRDTGLVVAAGSDDFTVQVGEAGIGTITSTVPLTPVP